MATDSPAPPILRQSSPTQTLRYILRLITGEFHADQVCVCGYRRESRQLERLADHPAELAPSIRSALQRQMAQSLSDQDPTPQLLTGDALSDTGFASGLIVPLQVQDIIIGVLALFAHEPDAFTFDAIDQLAELISLVRIVLENLYLYDALTQNIIISQLIVLTAQTIMDNPSPQQIIDVLRERLFDAHITSCAILLYGPVSEDRPNGPFDYLEMAGSWSRRRGGAIALGTKIYLKDYPEYLHQLDTRETLVFVREVGEFIAQLDPFVRSLIRAERIRALTLVPLHAGQRKIGILFIGSDRPHVFSEQEL
ncbi:MAG: GAF domain-containing protein, partial [Anaerolineae bacterium]|nr:GAF domain-containing protein [Anaerolineae bacterium]